ncbi:hypothetical protein [Nonomuraea candida]|nr:hypothetical protein [Nonomuraea candida]
MLSTTKFTRRPWRRGFLRKQIRQLLKPIDPKRVMRATPTSPSRTTSPT